MSSSIGPLSSYFNHLEKIQSEFPTEIESTEAAQLAFSETAQSWTRLEEEKTVLSPGDITEYVKQYEAARRLGKALQNSCWILKEPLRVASIPSEALEAYTVRYGEVLITPEKKLLDQTAKQVETSLLNRIQKIWIDLHKNILDADKALESLIYRARTKDLSYLQWGIEVIRSKSYLQEERAKLGNGEAAPQPLSSALNTGYA